MGIQPGHQRWLAETKFHPPSLREDIIPRQVLLTDLHAQLTSLPLTLLSAPPGYGKTTLLAAFHSAYPDLPLAWLSLDEEDNDTARFLTGLIIALKHLNPHCGEATLALLSNIPNPGDDVRRVVSVLINDVLETLSDPFTLVLDDLHQIGDAAIYVGLDYLLELMPPHMHLAISTRRDPPLSLARLRGRGQVAELRLAGLRFDEEEARAFLNDRLGLELSQVDLDLLYTHTEGWPVGLRLLAGSFDFFPTVEDRRTFIHHLSHNERYVFDFLAEEVFNRQEPEVQDFLLKTSILPELTAALCQAVTKCVDSGVTLEDLYHRNLFLIEKYLHPGENPLQSAGSHLPNSHTTQYAYYYHDLFSKFLVEKLEREHSELVPRLHLRAAGAQTDPSRVIGHFLAAGRWQEAARVIEQIGAEMFAFGYLDTLTRWIDQLPASVLERHPRLLHYLSNTAILRGDRSEVQALLERALLGFETAGNEAAQGEVLANLATCAIFQGDLERSAELFKRALTLPIPSHIRVQTLLGIASLKLCWGDWIGAELGFNAAMGLIEGSGELNLLDMVTFPFFDPGFAFLPGGLEHMERICRQAKALVGDETSPLRLIIEELAATLHLFRGQIENAIQTAEYAHKLKERLGGHPFLGIESELFLAIAHAIRGEYTAAEPLLNKVFEEFDFTYFPTVDMADLLYGVGRIRWQQGRVNEAREIYQMMCTVEDPLRDTPAARICRVWMWSLLEITEGRFDTAERALRQPEVIEQSDRRSTISGSTRLMLARLYLAQDRRREALTELAPVLDYHEKLGVPIAILMEGQSIVPLLRLAVEKDVHANYAAQLLEMLGATGEIRPVFVEDNGQALSIREVEVLRLVAAGDSNQAIAEKLVISKWTVKSHLTQIYRKLEVSSRTQAVVRARELGIR